MTSCKDAAPTASSDRPALSPIVVTSARCTKYGSLLFAFLHRVRLAGKFASSIEQGHDARSAISAAVNFDRTMPSPMTIVFTSWGRTGKAARTLSTISARLAARGTAALDVEQFLLIGRLARPHLPQFVDRVDIGNNGVMTRALQPVECYLPRPLAEAFLID